jgi:uncharacterized protein
MNIPTEAVAVSANTNTLFPVFLKLEEKRLLIVGGGNVALEKLKAVIKNSPATPIILVAPFINHEIRTIASLHSNIILRNQTFRSSDLDNADILIVAINDKKLASSIKLEANLRGLLVNVADVPELCDFYLGAIVQKGNLKIAISTNGKSPTLAKRMKELLTDSIPEEFDDLLNVVSKLRLRLNGDFSDKVRQLNTLTQSLLEKDNVPSFKNERYWRKIAYLCIGALACLFIGNGLARYITIGDVGTGIAFIYERVPKELYLMLLTGFLAQIADGALGMGYGVICTSVLLAAGIPLPVISGGIHTAEMFSSGASGLSHYKFGNVNKKLFKIILFPAIIGSFIGAFVLSKWGLAYAQYFRPLLAVYTLLLGIRILSIALRKDPTRKKITRAGWLGFFGGFLDSIGGGGWGPLVTSTLISKGKSAKYVVGTVSLTEFFVTLVSAVTFFVLIGVSHWQVITGLIIGGLLGAPVAARLTGRLPRKTGLIAIGIMIIIWSFNILLRLL